MSYLGDYQVGATVRIFFSTNDSTGAKVAPSSAFVAADFKLFQNGSAVERTSTAGITVTSPFNAQVGLHYIGVNTGDNTDAGFYVTGRDINVVMDTAKTIDGKVVTAIVGSFSLENRNASIRKINNNATAAANLALSAEGIVSGAFVGTPTTTVQDTDLTNATTDFYKGALLIITSGSGAGQRVGITGYNGTTKELTTDPLALAPAAADTFVIV